MSSHILYVDNTGYIQLEGYKNGLTDEYINDAIVNVSFTDINGSAINGLLPTISLNYEADSNGDYSASISENASWIKDDIVKAKIVAVSSGIQSTFNCNVIIRERKCS